MNVIMDEIKYCVGDKIHFTDSDNYEYVGEIKFGIYEDSENYVDFKHLGFYVEYKHKFHQSGHDLSRDTLPDVVNLHKGKLIK